MQLKNVIKETNKEKDKGLTALIKFTGFD